MELIKLIKHVMLFISIMGTSYNGIFMTLLGIKSLIKNDIELGYTAYRYYLQFLLFALILGISLYSGFTFQY
jgi:hypothetical protein